MQSSPTALLAWRTFLLLSLACSVLGRVSTLADCLPSVAEKFRDWVDEELSKDQILETVTVWWLLGSKCLIAVTCSLGADLFSLAAYPQAIYAYSEVPQSS